MLSRVQAIADVEHRRDGPHRPDAAVGDDARRLQGAGPHRGRGACSSTTTRSRCRRPAASRSCSRRCRPRSRRAITAALDDPDDRHRRGRRTATARCSSGTTCSGMYQGHAPRFVKRYAETGADDPRRGRAATRADVRSGAFPEELHTYGISDRGARAVRVGAGRGAATALTQLSSRSSPTGTTTANAHAAPARAHVQPCTARTPITSRAAAQTRNAIQISREDVPPAPASEPPDAEDVLAVDARASPARAISDSAIGTAANARMCRERRYVPCEPSSFTPRVRGARRARSTRTTP